MNIKEKFIVVPCAVAGIVYSTYYFRKHDHGVRYRGPLFNIIFGTFVHSPIGCFGGGIVGFAISEIINDKALLCMMGLFSAPPILCELYRATRKEPDFYLYV